VALMPGLQVAIRHKTYGSNGVRAIEALSLDVAEGEFVALVGPSGAGKTTLLNVVSGVDPDFDGDLQLDDRPLHRNGDDRGRLGFLFQDSRLMPWLSVLDNVQLVLGRGDAARARAVTLVREVGLADFAHAYPGQLSGGMQRRVGLARAFAVEPQLLLMDEPFQSLDAPTADYLRGLLMKLWNETRPIVLFVTHSLREALALADRVVFLSDRPAHMLFDLTVGLPRPRRLEDPAVNALHDDLLRRHPDLLSGDGTASTDERASSAHPAGSQVGV
jgi:NitT/TauT family transport system ATP-binding protein